MRGAVRAAVLVCYPFEKMHTHSFPIEQAEDAIHALAGAVPSLNPLHIAIVPGAPRVRL